MFTSYNGILNRDGEPFRVSSAACRALSGVNDLFLGWVGDLCGNLTKNLRWIVIPQSGEKLCKAPSVLASLALIFDVVLWHEQDNRSLETEFRPSRNWETVYQLYRNIDYVRL